MNTTTQSASPDLRRWIIEQTEAGCRPQDVLAAMRASGWQEDVAAQAMQGILSERLDELRTGPPETMSAASALPEPDLQGAPTVITIDGHELRVLLTLRHPRVVLFGGFLSDDECKQLMALAEPRLQRSETIDNATGGSEVNAARTSDGMFFERGEHALIQTIEKRIAVLLRWPAENGEGLQVLRYRPGAQYRAHNDYFDPAYPGTEAVLKRGGQRVGTLVMYLNTPQAGGATSFPDAGLDVASVRGNAVFFSYDRPHPATRTLHAGAPVFAGEKWIAVKWMRERVFD